MSYLRKLQDLSAAISAKSGAVVAVTAEPESELPRTRSASGYQGPVIVDPANLLAAEFARQDSLDVAVTAKGGYEHGMAQPAILVSKGHNMNDMLFKWAIVPGFVSGSRRDSLRHILGLLPHSFECFDARS